MVHDAAETLVGVIRDVEHEFDPVRTVGNLKRDPIRFVVFHAAVPVGAKTEDVFVKAFHLLAVVDNKAGVEKRWPNTDTRRQVIDSNKRKLNKRNPMAFRVL